MGSSLLPWNGADKDTYCLKTKRNLDFSRFPDSVCERIRTPGLLIRSYDFNAFYHCTEVRFSFIYKVFYMVPCFIFSCF